MNDPQAVARCLSVAGDVWTGPQYCGWKAATTDRNGRPVCNTHGRKCEGIEWRGDRGNYPHGIGGTWKYRHGAPR